MTKKHFVAFAAQIKDMVDNDHIKEARFSMGMIISVARKDNPKFNENLFMKACGLS